MTSSNENINYNWAISICLDELKFLFRDLQEITKENFIHLSNHITYMLMIIEKILRFYKPLTPTGSMSSRSNRSSAENSYSGKQINKIIIIIFKHSLKNV